MYGIIVIELAIFFCGIYLGAGGGGVFGEKKLILFCRLSFSYIIINQKLST